MPHSVECRLRKGNDTAASAIMCELLDAAAQSLAITVDNSELLAARTIARPFGLPIECALPAAGMQPSHDGLIGRLMGVCIRPALSALLWRPVLRLFGFFVLFALGAGALSIFFTGLPYWASLSSSAFELGATRGTFRNACRSRLARRLRVLDAQ